MRGKGGRESGERKESEGGRGRGGERGEGKEVGGGGGLNSRGMTL
jgi:hypothetical protein